MSFGIQVKVVTRGKFTSSMHEFLNVIIELNLVDLQLEKEIKVHWSNSIETPSMSRIHQVLVSIDWED